MCGDSGGMQPLQSKLLLEHISRFPPTPDYTVPAGGKKVKSKSKWWKRSLHVSIHRQPSIENYFETNRKKEKASIYFPLPRFD